MLSAVLLFLLVLTLLSTHPFYSHRCCQVQENAKKQTDGKMRVNEAFTHMHKHMHSEMGDIIAVDTDWHFVQYGGVTGMLKLLYLHTNE